MNPYELIDALEDVGYKAEYQFPYVIVDMTNRGGDPEVIAWALDIDPSRCCYNLNGNVRITCD